MILIGTRPANHHRLPATGVCADQPRNRVFERHRFTSVRPEKLYGVGPDNLWALGPDRYAVTELKTGCTTSLVAKKDLDQLGGSVRWDHQQHPGVQSVPVIVHPRDEYDEHGTASLTCSRTRKARQPALDRETDLSGTFYDLADGQLRQDLRVAARRSSPPGSPAPTGPSGWRRPTDPDISRLRDAHREPMAKRHWFRAAVVADGAPWLS